jgi:hypothetical protein
MRGRAGAGRILPAAGDYRDRHEPTSSAPPPAGEFGVEVDWWCGHGQRSDADDGFVWPSVKLEPAELDLSAAQKKKLFDDETKIDFLKKDLNNKSKK